MNFFRWQIAQYFEYKWWKAYLRRRPVDGYLNWKKEYWNKFLDIIEYKPGENAPVLDAGCGPAGIFTSLVGCEVTAIDPLIEDYEKLDHFNPDWYPHVRFVTDKLENLTLNGAFKTIFCINAINHVSDIERSLSNLYNALLPSGKMFLSVDVHKHEPIKRIFRIIPFDILHPHQYDLTDYNGILHKAGFRLGNPKRLNKGQIFDYYVLTAFKDNDI